MAENNSFGPCSGATRKCPKNKPRAKPFRAGLYARVSTHDQQTLLLQNRAMQDYAARCGWTIAIEIKEVGSGASARRRAPHSILKERN
jgi:predicted site-specific integrase-resolvase